MSNTDVHQIIYLNNQIKNYLNINKTNKKVIGTEKILYDISEIKPNNADLYVVPPNFSYICSPVNELVSFDFNHFERKIIQECPEIQYLTENDLIKNHVCIAGGFISKILSNNWNNKKRICEFENNNFSNLDEIKSALDLTDQPKSDVDIFIYGLEDKEKANKLLNDILAIFINFWSNKILFQLSFVKYRNIINVYVYFQNQIYRKYQIICKLNYSLANILYNFDLYSSQVAYDFKTLQFTLPGKYAFENKINIVDLNNVNDYSYESRIIKYFYRGFNLLLQNHDSHYLNFNITSDCQHPIYKINAINATNYSKLKITKKYYNKMKELDKYSCLSDKNKYINKSNLKLLFKYINRFIEMIDSNNPNAFNIFKNELQNEQKFYHHQEEITNEIENKIINEFLSKIWCQKNNIINCIRLEYLLKSNDSNDDSILMQFFTKFFDLKTKNEKMNFCQNEIVSWFRSNCYKDNNDIILIQILKFIKMTLCNYKNNVQWSDSNERFNIGNRVETIFSYF